MSDVLLGANRCLTGPRRVTATIRPLRLAYLVDPSDPGTALAAIDACCLLWGGSLQFLIPCPPGGEPDSSWNRMMERHDPDEIVDLVGASQEFVEHQVRFIQRPVLRWERPTETMLLRGVLLTSALQRRIERGVWSPTNVILNLHPLFGHQMALPLAFRHGHLERRPMERDELLREAYISSSTSDVAQFQTVDPHELPQDELVRLVTEEPLLPSTPDRPGWIGPPANCLIHVTKNLAADGCSGEVALQLFHRMNDDERRHGVPYAQRLVIVGPTDGVLDLCLAWDLRAQRLDRPDPIWISPEWLNEPAVRLRLEMALADNRRRGFGLADKADDYLCLVSASLADELLTEMATLLPRAVAHRRDETFKLLPNRVHVGYVRRSTAIFVDGVADVVLPDASDLGITHRFETLGVSVHVPGWRLPRMPAPDFGGSSDIVRVAVDGLAGDLRLDWWRLPDLVTVWARNGKEAIDAIVSAAGLSATVSDKGRLAIAILDLFESLDNLSLLASSRVYELLNDMAAGVIPRQDVQRALARHFPDLVSPASIDAVVSVLQEGLASDRQFHRRPYTWSRIREKLGVGVDDARWVVTFLVERGIIFRGYEITCRSCGLPRWQPIDRLASTYECDGCHITTPIPLPVSSGLEWRFRLNELVAHAVDQGVLPQLLAVRYLADRERHPASELLGLLPGVAFTAPGSTDLLGEVDLLAIAEGRVLLGECKRTGATLAIGDVDKTFALATRFERPTVVFATPSGFDQATQPMEQVRSKSGTVVVELWEQPDMLDPRSNSQIPQSSPERYLANVVKWLRERQAE